VYSEGDYIRTYVDGILDREMATTAVLGSSTGNLTIGREAFSESNYFNGMIDDVHVYSDALTQGQILTVSGIGTLYVPVPSPANVHDLEPVNSKIVNFLDYAALMEKWLLEELWP